LIYYIYIQSDDGHLEKAMNRQGIHEYSANEDVANSIAGFYGRMTGKKGVVLSKPDMASSTIAQFMDNESLPIMYRRQAW
jgi:hypothetical protein